MSCCSASSPTAARSAWASGTANSASTRKRPRSCLRWWRNPNHPCLRNETAAVGRRFFRWEPHAGSTHPVGDAALGQVVRRHFHLDLVAGEDSDVVLAHAARNVSSHDVPVFQLHAEHGVGQGFLHRTFHFDDVVFGHGLRWAREKGTPHFAMKWRLAKAPIARGTVWPCETMAVHSSNRHKLRLVCKLLHATLARFRQGTPRDARRLRPSSP